MRKVRSLCAKRWRRARSRAVSLRSLSHTAPPVTSVVVSGPVSGAPWSGFIGLAPRSSGDMGGFTARSSPKGPRRRAFAVAVRSGEGRRAAARLSVAEAQMKILQPMIQWWQWYKEGAVWSGSVSVISGLLPEEKPKLYDLACERELQNVD